MNLDLPQNFVSAQYLENELTESDQILYAHRKDLAWGFTRHCFSHTGKKLRSGAIVILSDNSSCIRNYKFLLLKSLYF